MIRCYVCKTNEVAKTRTSCKLCRNEYLRGYRERTKERDRIRKREWRREYRRKHPDKEKAAKQRYRQKHKAKVRAAKAKYQRENATKVQQYQIHYRTANAEILAAKAKHRKAKFYLENKQLVQTRVQNWRSKNPDKVKAIARTQCAIRRARKFAAEGKYTIWDVRELYNQQKGLCAACECELRSGYHVDHIMPLSRGGSNWPDNLQLLCPFCNCSKKDRTMDEFLRHRRKDT